MGIFLALRAMAAEGLAPYPAPEQAGHEVRELGQLYPGQVEIFIAGFSTGGREILCLRISRGDGMERPAALIAGAIHGDEYIANRAAMAAGKMLLSGEEPVAEEVLSLMDVYIMPLLNPDGYQATWDSAGELPPKKTRTNGHGVDLNRNFGKPRLRIPIPFGYSGYQDPESDRWVGPYPLSEPESQMVRDLARERKFFAAVDFHSAAGMIIPMLADDRLTQRGLRKMAQAYRKAQADKYPIVMFPWWIPIYQGSMEEGMHREAGTLPLLIELGKKRDMSREAAKNNHFWMFNPQDPAVIKRVAEDNARAALFALLEGYRYTGGHTTPRSMDVE